MGRIRPLHLFYPNKQRQGEGNDRIAPRPDPEKSEEPIEFVVEGDRARHALPAGASPRPVGAVALAHGWSMVAGGDLEDYAAAIVEQAALTFDFRNLGRSDGQPRQEIDPQRQIQDFRAAISYLRRRPEVDRERIGIWGSSYSGGHAPDRRRHRQAGQVRGEPGAHHQRLPGGAAPRAL